MSLALASDRSASADRPADALRHVTGVRLASLAPGARGSVVRILTSDPACADRLAALGVTPGAAVVVLQTFPAFVFSCDQTELAVEPAVARTVLVELS